MTSTPYALMGATTSSTTRLLEVFRCTGALLLAIVGSALTPLPCAFSLSGLALGTLILLLIGIANDYTTVIMVRAAAELGVSGYEEIVERASGPRSLVWCQVSLVILLFGSMCCCLEVIQETSTRALGEVALEANGALASGWLSGTSEGQAVVLVTLTTALLLPLSLASMGELPIVSAVGVAMMALLCLYVTFLASGIVEHHVPLRDAGLAQPTPQQSHSTIPSFADLSKAASTFGYAFYIQPCALPLLRGLPDGAEGGSILERALHLTFVLTAASYLTVGVGGLVIFGDGHVPQDLLQGFGGRVGGALSGLFCLYLCLCFPPILVPLREVLVRLWHRSAGNVRERDGDVAHASVLPPLYNALLTAALIGGALAIALLLPDASSTLFALTGATGVCCVSYIFPILTYWGLSRQQSEGASSKAAAASHSAHFVRFMTYHAWPAFVLGLGTLASALTLWTVVRSLASSAADGATCGGE